MISVVATIVLLLVFVAIAGKILGILLDCKKKLIQLQFLSFNSC